MSTETSPPPLPRTVAPARGSPLWLLILLGVVGVLGALCYFGYDFYQLHHFPPGYRNRPASGWGTRPGEDEFERADALIDRAGGTNAFGNTTEAVALAHAFAEAVTGVRDRSFTKGFEFDWLEPQQHGRFLVYCELHREECAFLVHVPGLRRFDEDFTEKVDARRALAQLVWLTAQTVMKDRQTGRPEMELAVGLRGVSQYSPIMLGYSRENPSGPEDGIVKYIDDTTQRHYLWAFFAPAAPVRGARGIGH